MRHALTLLVALDYTAEVLTSLEVLLRDLELKQHRAVPLPPLDGRLAGDSPLTLTLLLVVVVRQGGEGDLPLLGTSVRFGITIIAREGRGGVDVDVVIEGRLAESRRRQQGRCRLGSGMSRARGGGRGRTDLPGVVVCRCRRCELEVRDGRLRACGQPA